MYDVVTRKIKSICEKAGKINNSVDVGRLCSTWISDDSC